MDTRDTPEQAELRRSARQLARDLGPTTVADLDDEVRAKRLGVAVRETGWLELRDDAGEGGPLAGGVEAAIVADALGGSVADVGFAGAVLARDLVRRAGLISGALAGGPVVALAPGLTDAAVVPGPATTTPVYAVDGDDDLEAAYVLVPDDDGYRLGLVRFDRERGASGADLTRRLRMVATGAPVEPVPDQDHLLTK